MKYFFWYGLNTIVHKFNNSNIGTVNAVQKKFVYLHQSLFLLQFSFANKPAFYYKMGKSYDDIYHSPPHVSVFTGNMLITIMRFAHYHLPLAYNSSVMIDSMYLVTIQIFPNLNEHYNYLISTASVIWQIDANYSPFQLLNMLPFHIRLECLKLMY